MILVTGSTGMVGQHVTELLANNKIPFVGTSSTEKNCDVDSYKHIKWDLRESLNQDELSKKFGKVSAIFHLGALVPNAYNKATDNDLFNANVHPSVILAQWACSLGIPIIYLSGATVYADPFQSNISEEAEVSFSEIGGFYSYTKLMAEKIFQYYVSQGLKLTILRASSIYGYKLSSEKMINKFLDTALTNETIYISPPADESINLIHASDVAKAMMSVWKKEIFGIYNIAYYREYSVYEIASACVQLIKKGRIEVKDVKNNINNTRIKFSLNIDKAIKTFGFNPEIDLCTGLSKIINKSFCKY